MLPRILKHPALLASLAIHGVALGAGICFGWGAAPVSRPAILLGMETCEVVGSVDLDASPPPPDPAFEPIPEPIVEMPPPEEVEAPVDESPATAAVPTSPPSFFDAAPVGVRKVAKASPAPMSAPVATPAPVALPRPVAFPRPVAGAAPSRRGSFTESRAAVRIGNTTPSYPVEALRGRWEGTTVLDVRVTSEGVVSSATVYASSGYAVLDDAAVAACLAYRYLPRLVDGVPAPDWLRQPFTWSVQQP